MGDSSVSCGDDSSVSGDGDHNPFHSLLRPNTSLFHCNGPQICLLPDFLAEKMGLPRIPAFHADNGTIEGLENGINFRSTQATILSLRRLGFQGLNQQLRQAFETLQLLQLQLGQEKSQEVIESSVFYLSLGKVDDISVRHRFSKEVFTQILVDQMIRVVKDLYNAHVKKIVCIGIGPLGCAPRALWESSGENDSHHLSHTSSNFVTCNGWQGCMEDVNDLVLEYNALFSEQHLDLNFEFPDAQIIFCDGYQAMVDIISFSRRYRFKNVNRSCCESGRCGGMTGCQANEMACDQPLLLSAVAYAHIMTLFICVLLSLYLLRITRTRTIKQKQKILGTTNLTFICEHATLIAADGLQIEYDLITKTYKPMLENALKVFALHDKLYATYAGNVDLYDELSKHLMEKTRERAKMQWRRKLTPTDYAKLSHTFMVDNYGGEPAVHGTIMFAGYVSNKPSVTIASKGGYSDVKRHQCTGSGWLHSMVVIGEGHRQNMSTPEMISLAKKALVNSAKFDGQTGGLTNRTAIRLQHQRTEDHEPITSHSK